MGRLMYISCVLLVATVPLIDPYTLLKPTSSVADFCLGEELHLSCGVRFGTLNDVLSLSEVGWYRGEGEYGRINVTACKSESEECTATTTDGRGFLRYSNASLSTIDTLALIINNSILEDNVTFSCFTVDKNGDQTSQNISAIAHSLPNKESYPICSIKTCSYDNADNACTLSCMAEMTQPVVSLEWVTSGTNSTEVTLSNNTVVNGSHVLLLYNVTERYNNATFTCRLSSDEFPCLNMRNCSIEPADCSEECPPGEFTSVPSTFSTRASGVQNPTGFSLVMIIIITAAGTQIVIILPLILVCFVRSKGSKIKRAKRGGTTTTSTTTSCTRRHQNVFEDVNLYTIPDGEQTVQVSPRTSVDLEQVQGGKAGPPTGVPSLTYEVVSEAATDGDSQVVMKTPSQNAQVYEVLGLDETEKTSSTDETTRGGCQLPVETPSQAALVLEPGETERATDNQGPTCGGSEDVVKTPSQAAPFYVVLEPEEAKTPTSDEGATYEECDVHAFQEKEPFGTAEDPGKAEEGPNKGAGSPWSFIQDSEEGELIENILYVPYKETRTTE